MRTLARCAVALCTAMLTAACGRSEPAAELPAAEAHDPAAHAAPITAGWMVTDGIETPESVYVDAASGFIFASQIAGAPDGRDGNGHIVKLGGDGQIVSSAWVTGLNAPKGLRSHNGTLWTADLDEVIGIDIASGAVTSRTKIDGALFLNDVAVGPDGTVYVSDMMANRIHAVRDGKAAVFAEGEQLEWPNGRDGRGGYVVSDYLAGKVMQVSATGEVRDLRQFKPGAADIAFVPAGNVLIVPHMNENGVGAYDLSDVLR
jgi:hypothetical protein